MKLYLIALPIFFLVDMLWLGFVAKDFYRNYIGFLMRADVLWSAALVFYLLFVAGLVFFAIVPAVEKEAWTHAFAYGAFFGLVTYAAYDLTNLATLKDWPLLVTIVDLIWGALLSGFISVVTYVIATKISP